MTRLLAAFLSVSASAACVTTGAYSPRPFPTGPAGVAAPAPSLPGPDPSASHAPAGVLPDPSGPAGVSSPGVPHDRAAMSAAVLSTAMGLTGVPYQLGGASPSGFDCSGFVQYVLGRHGIVMPRTVIEQYDVGDVTPAIEPGDLVFFETVGSNASHVGIAVDASSFVHAPNSRGVVRVDRLDAPYWADRFLGARRIF